MMNSVQIDCKGPWHKLPLTRQECKDFFSKVCSFHGINSISFELIITDDAESRKLNKSYLQANSPTNILSFPQLREQREDTSFIGSLVLSTNTLNREAFLYFQDKESYTKQLLIHGFAHLLGFDHSSEMDLFCIKSLEVADNTVQ